MNQAPTLEQAVSTVVDSVKAQMPNITSLQQFFSMFDCYQGRVFEAWELKIIFPSVSLQCLDLLHDINNASAKLSKGEITLHFLIDEIEMVWPSLLKTKPPLQSMYVMKTTEPHVQQLLIEIGSDREVQFNAAQAYDYIFQQADQVDYVALEKALKARGIAFKQASDLLDLMQYFQVDIKSRSFGKIQFVQAIKPFIRPPNQSFSQTKSSLLRESIQDFTDDFRRATTHVQKKCQCKGLRLEQFLQAQHPLKLTQQDFVNTFGTKLELIPKVSTQLVLQQMFKEAGNTIPQIVKFFDQYQVLTVAQMKQQLIAKIKAQSLLPITQNQDYVRSKKMQVAEFTEVLQIKFDLTQIDAEFLSSFYKRQDWIDVYLLVQDIEGKRIEPQLQKLFDGLRKTIEPSRYELEQSMKSQSTDGFLNLQQIMLIFNSTLKLRNSSQLNEKQTRDICGLVEQNRLGEYNYKDLLTLLFQQHPQQQVTAKSSSKKVLSADELRTCQDLVVEIRKDLEKRGIQINRLIGSDVTIRPPDFKKALTANCSAEMLQKLPNSVLGNLVYYLIREEPAKVSAAKLEQALALLDHDPPLPQEGLELEQPAPKRQTTKVVLPVPQAIVDLNEFLKKSGTTYLQLFNVTESTKEMSLNQFEQALLQSSYQPKDKQELITCLLDKYNISLTILQKHLRQLQPSQVDPNVSKQKYGRMDESIRTKIAIISDYLVRNGITIEQFHSVLDTNGDNKIDRQEFVSGVMKVVISGSITSADLEDIFKAIDINNDQLLSVNEFSLFVQGAKLKRDQRISKQDLGVRSQVDQEIDHLYQYLDKGKGVSATELQRAMQAIKPVTLEQAQQMIRQVDSDKDGHITHSEFHTLLQPTILDEFIKPEKDLEDVRSLFKSADTDMSGYLSADELYKCLHRMGADVTKDEVVQLFAEFDIDGNMQLDIDEFVAIMAVGDQVNFTNQSNLQTFLKIKQARKLDKLAFLKLFNAMPHNFVPSFYTERWIKSKSNLPSSVFRVQIDPRTLLWKDMMTVLPEQLTPEQARPENRPRLRPVASSVGAQITIESAEGVPIPEANKDRDGIVKRVIRMGLYDTVKQDLVYNSAHVVAAWTAKQEDIWTIAKDSPLLFRSTIEEDLNKQDVMLVFELVVYSVSNGKTTEMSCGWAQTQLASCDKDQRLKLQIEGGSPLNQTPIDKEDVRTKRSGVKGFIKLFNKTIHSSLVISIKPLTNVEPETKLHLELMPSTCVLPKRMLYLLSGFRNYAAEKLLAQTQVGILKKPSGDLMLSCFPKLYDCPDMQELIQQVWHEDHFSHLSSQQKRSVELMMAKAQEFVTKLYPVLYAVDFNYNIANPTESVCGDALKYQARQMLVKNALRPGLKKPAEAMTFKPFNIRELQYEVWDDQDAKLQKMKAHFQKVGITQAPAQTGKIVIPEVK